MLNRSAVYEIVTPGHQLNLQRQEHLYSRLEVPHSKRETPGGGEWKRYDTVGLQDSDDKQVMVNQLDTAVVDQPEKAVLKDIPRD